MDNCVIHFLFYINVWRCRTISELMINEQIRDREVRLIGENGEQLGIMSAKDAYKLAQRSRARSGEDCSDCEAAGMQDHRLW